MTIYSQRAQTVAESRDVHGEPRLERPVIEEQFWGYEIGPSPVERGALAMSRGVLTLIASAFAVAAIAIWLVPTGASELEVPLARLLISAVLGGAAAFLHGRALARRVITLEVDTANGELREVIGVGASRRQVVGEYGFDSVDAVDLHEAGSRGQVQIRLRDGGLIAAGTGMAAYLVPLRARLEADLSLAVRGDQTPPSFAGPLTR
jgi:hypothetical protein